MATNAILVLTITVLIVLHKSYCSNYFAFTHNKGPSQSSDEAVLANELLYLCKMIYAKELENPGTATIGGGEATPLKRSDEIEQVCQPLITKEIGNLKQELKRLDPAFFKK